MSNKDIDTKHRKLNLVDTITLECLADGYKISPEINKKEVIQVDEIKFYRKRLNNMVKERILKLIENNGQRIETPDNIINSLIFNIVKEGIKELKHHDWMELQNNEIGNIEPEVNNNNLENQESFDEILFTGKSEPKCTLDDFVERKNINLVNNIEYPKKNKYNLRDKKLKYKGLNELKKEESKKEEPKKEELKKEEPKKEEPKKEEPKKEEPKKEEPKKDKKKKREKKQKVPENLKDAFKEISALE